MKKMATPAETIDDLERLDIAAIVQEALEEKKQEYIRLNLEQLYEGLGSDGQKLTPKYRSNKYARVKNEMNPAPGLGTPDFYVTGQLYDNTFADVDSGGLEIDSRMDYTPKLEERWGEDLMWGLIDDNHELFVEEELQE